MMWSSLVYGAMEGCRITLDRNCINLCLYDLYVSIMKYLYTKIDFQLVCYLMMFVSTITSMT